MEAEKPQDLLSASWRPRTASGVIQSKSPLRTRGVTGVNLSWRVGEHEKKCPSLNSEAGKKG